MEPIISTFYEQECRDNESNQIITACKGRPEAEPSAQVQNRAWGKVSSDSRDCGFEGLVPSVHLQCSDLYFLSWDIVFSE